MLESSVVYLPKVEVQVCGMLASLLNALRCGPLQRTSPLLMGAPRTEAFIVRCVISTLEENCELSSEHNFSGEADKVTIPKGQIACGHS